MLLPTSKELLAASVRAVRRMLREQFTGTAAELSYYGLLSTVPCIAVLVGIVGLFGSNPETTQAFTEILREGVSTEAGKAARDAVRQVVENNSGAGVALGAGVMATLWVASVYLTAFRRAAHRVHGVDPGPAWRGRPLQMVLTFVGLLVIALVVIVLIVTRRLMSEIGEAAGAEDATVAIWSVFRWPLTLLLVVAITAGLFNLAPREGRSRLRPLSVGLVAAVVVWMLASLGFEVWVGNFADYDATYGALAGSIAFAVWLWISNLALLFGLVLDLELDAAPEQRAGLTSDEALDRPDDRQAPSDR